MQTDGGSVDPGPKAISTIEADTIGRVDTTNEEGRMEFEKVVIGIDFSRVSRAAAQWVADHFAPDAELILVHSVELPKLPGFLAGLTPKPAEVVDTAREGAETRLLELGAILGAEKVRHEVTVGRPSEQINVVAREVGADLIVVGEHGRGRGLSGVIGTTADRTLRLATVPVLLARGLPDGPPESVLIPIDESETSKLALGWGKSIMETFDTEVRALYAVSPLISSRIRAVSTATREEHLQQDLIRNAENWLREEFERASFDRERLEVEVTVGEPGYEITAAAKRFGVDLIVMGSRGSGALAPALLGRVTRLVLRGSKVPVLVIKGSAP